MATPNAEAKVLAALEKIERAQHALESACADLSPIIGGMPDWKRVGKLADKTHAAWRKLAYNSRSNWRLDSERENQ